MGNRPAPTAEGQLSKTPFAHVLLYMRERELSGTLSIEARASIPEVGGESLLAFDRGALAQMRLPIVVDPLGFVLREMGLIDEAALNDSLGRLARREGLQGEILRKLNACDDAAIENGLREQVRRKALRLFAVTDASYAYYAGVDLLQGWGGSRVRVDVLPLLWRGVRGYPDARAIEGVLAKVGSQLVRLRAGSDLRLFEFDRNEQGVIDVLRYDSAPLEALLSAGTDSHLARSIVYLLLISKQAEIVAPGTRAVRAKASIPPRPSDAVGLKSRPSSTPAYVAPQKPLPASVRPPRPSDPVGPGGLPEDITPELRVRYEEARARLVAMEDETYFQMLGIETDSSTEKARSAFLVAAAKWHPDRAPSGSRSLHDLYQDIFAYLTEAQETLASDEQAGRYLNTVKDGGGTPSAQRKIGALLEAATDAQKAEVCLRRREFDEAERLVRRALATSPEDPGSLCTLAAALSERRVDMPPSDEVVRLLTQAVSLAPKFDRARVQLGTALKRRGDARGALAQFRAAVEANPKNNDAVRELRLAQMRSRDGVDMNAQAPADKNDPKKKPEGIFGRFLKK
ncbi:MAG: hypothetical protein WCJ30_03050 [Deltaproteobacteria bacterium]